MPELSSFPDYSPLGFQHRPLIADLLARKGVHSSDYSFYNLWGWHISHPPTISRIGEHVSLCVEGPEGSHLHLAPIGPGSIKEPLGILLDHLSLTGFPLSLKYVPGKLKEEIAVAFPGCRAEEQRADFDYLYDRRELAQLTGRKFHQKKNFVNRVIEDLRPEVEILEDHHQDEILEYLVHWYSDFAGEDDNVKIENLAIARSLKSLSSMGGLGVVVRVAGKLVGFSMASPIHGECWDVTVEKTERSLKGMYQFLNWALVNRLPTEVKLVNRETDLGIEGLRTAKMSYHPVCFEKKFTILF